MQFSQMGIRLIIVVMALTLLKAPLVFADEAGTEGSAVAHGGPKTTKPLNDFELGRYQYCGNDADCVVANNGCCDCANGGQDVAINKERLTAFEDRFACAEVMCTQMAPLRPCGSGVVSCVNHKCKYFEGEEVKF